MDPLNVKEFGWALGGENVLVPELEREVAELLVRVAADPSKLLGDDWSSPRLTAPSSPGSSTTTSSGRLLRGVSERRVGLGRRRPLFHPELGLRAGRDPCTDADRLRRHRRAQPAAARRMAGAQRPERRGRDRGRVGTPSRSGRDHRALRLARPAALRASNAMGIRPGMRWASRCKDAGSPDSDLTIGATEDLAAGRPAWPGDTTAHRVRSSAFRRYARLRQGLRVHLVVQR